MGELLTLAERFEAKAKSALKTECAKEYHAYWRGYATACEEAAAALRARSGEHLSPGDGR